MKREDDPSADLDRGLPMLVKRCDTAAATSATDADYVLLCVDSTGRLYIAGNDPYAVLVSLPARACTDIAVELRNHAR